MIWVPLLLRHGYQVLQKIFTYFGEGKLFSNIVTCVVLVGLVIWLLVTLIEFISRLFKKKGKQ